MVIVRALPHCRAHFDLSLWHSDPRLAGLGIGYRGLRSQPPLVRRRQKSSLVHVELRTYNAIYGPLCRASALLVCDVHPVADRMAWGRNSTRRMYPRTCTVVRSCREGREDYIRVKPR